MPHHRYVFVGGLHRSGTSLVARLIAALPGVASIAGAPVPENEGVYLQGAIAHTARHGRPMHFATDPDQHHVEGGIHDRLEVRDRIEADWAPWFADAPWRVEKSPPNLTRMRLYQQLFPLSQFVVVLRHPEAVAAATRKWVDRDLDWMVDHWIAAHARMADDLPWLHSVLVLRYEDLVADPSATVAMLAAFLDVAPVPVPEAVREGNAGYAGAVTLSPSQADRAGIWGYGPGMAVRPRPVQVAHPLWSVAHAVRMRGGGAT